MAKDDLTTEVSGLALSNSTFSASPPGSLLQAVNIVMPQKGVAEPRRGQQRLATLPSSTALPFAMAQFDGSVIVNYATGKDSTSYGLGVISSSSVTPYTGTFNPVDDDGSSTAYGRMKFGHAGEYLYFCTTDGPKALETAAGDPRQAGLLRMPDPLVFMCSPGANPIGGGEGLAYGESRAYRTVLRKPTENGTSLLSPPSGRQVVTNRLVAPPGAMVRTGGNTVTVTFPVNTAVQIGLDTGDTFTLDPGEADFPAGAYTVGSVTNNVLIYTDAGSNVANTAEQDFDTGPRCVAIEAFLSSDAIADETPVRVYRSRDTVTTEPDDEMFLVAERSPDSSEVTAGFAIFIDNVPQSVADDPLYTNPLTGAGEAEANLLPPVYRDTANWGGRQWYSNTTGLQQQRIQMLGVGTPDGVQNNDTITIANETFTFKTSAGAAPDVQIVSSGLPGYNVQQTAQNLCSAIAQHFAAQDIDIRAYYESPQSGAPGKILLEATSYETTEFDVDASRPESWVPALTATSQAERTPNALSYSKLSQPEAVPALNYLPIGSKNYPITRILGLEQALLVFKDGDGIYAVSGSAPFNVQQISVANILAADAACVLADTAWVYTDQGVLRVSDAGGSTVVSRPIETELNRLFALLPDETRDYSFMVPYEQERRLLLFVPFDIDDDTDLPALKAWCYNDATQAWTGPLYTDVFSGLVVNNLADSRAISLYLGIYDTAWSTSRITVERKNAEPDYKNYVDAAFTTTVTATDVDGEPTLLELASLTDVEVGDVIAQGSVATSKVVAIRDDVSATCIEVAEGDWATGAVSLGKGYEVTVQFQPQGNPTARKTLTRLTWLFKPEWFRNYFGNTLLMTDQVQAEKETATPSIGFGLATTISGLGFGATPFGDPSPLAVDVNPLDPMWTNAAQFFVGFSLHEGWIAFKLQGFSARLETQEAPAGRGR